MDKILNSIGLFKDETIDNLKTVFDEIDVLKNNSNNDGSDEISESGEENNENKDENNSISLKKESISGESYHLINPLSSPSAGATALKYTNIFLVASSSCEVKGLMEMKLLKKK